MKMIKAIIPKYKSLSQPAKSSLWFMLCFILQRGIQFLTMPIYSRIMTQEEYGVYSLFFSWYSILCVFTSLDIHSGAFAKAMVKYQDHQDEYASSMQTLTLLITLGFAIILAVFHNTITNITGFSAIFLMLMSVHLLTFPTLQYWTQLRRFRYQYIPMIVVTLFTSALTAIVGIGAILLFEQKALSLTAVTVLTQTVVCIWLARQLFYNGKKCLYNREYWKWSLCMAIPLLPHYLSEILLGHADRLMIGYMCGNSQAGIYNIVYQISMLMTVVRQGVNAAFTPWMYYSIKQKAYKKIKETSSLLALMMAMLTMCFILIAPELLKIAAPTSYYEAVWDMPAIMVGCYYIFVYALFVNVEIYCEKGKYVAIASVIASVLNIALNRIFIERFGYLAAGYTTMVSYLFMALIHYLFLRRMIKEQNYLSEIFNYHGLFILSALVTILGVLCLSIYDFALLRYLILLVIFLMVYRSKKKVLLLFSNLKRKG